MYWLSDNVDGFVNRNDARKYASSMLKAGYIRHTVHKLTFSEQCYYVFGDIYSQGKIKVSNGHRICSSSPQGSHN